MRPSRDDGVIKSDRPPVVLLWLEEGPGVFHVKTHCNAEEGLDGRAGKSKVEHLKSATNPLGME